MNRHLVCLTVDTDPDGLSGKVTNRRALSWKGLERLQSLPDELHDVPRLGEIPLTWFIRADGQLESILGSAAYLLDRYESFWRQLKGLEHELGWHPHLYRHASIGEPAVIISDPQEARDELEHLWEGVRDILPATSFRNGEGWHTESTYSCVEQLGFQCDSTAIPNRRGSGGNPMNWENAPNQPFFPSQKDLREPGPDRPMLELPMNTWPLQAPYDDAPRTRYMNPAVHPHLFANALRNWENTRKSTIEPCVWVMIFHPDEVSPEEREDYLYARSKDALCSNLIAFASSLTNAGAELEWVTIAEAAARWRASRQKRIA